MPSDSPYNEFMYAATGLMPLPDLLSDLTHQLNIQEIVDMLNQAMQKNAAITAAIIDIDTSISTLWTISDILNYTY